MKFKLDENVPRRAGDLLTNAGHDVSTVRDEGLTGESDEIVVRTAAAEERMLVTLDKDLGDLRSFRALKFRWTRSAWSLLLSILTLTGVTACSACNDIGCSGGVTFVVRGAEIHRRNIIQATACIDGECRSATGRFTDQGVGDHGGDGLEMDFSPEGLRVTLYLPTDRTYDSKTEHEVTLDATANGETFEVSEDVVLRAIIAGCSSCWGVKIDVP